MRLRLLGFGLALGLAGCGGGPPPAPIVFKPIDFSYLPPITLRVATVNVHNVYVPGPDEATLIGQDPEAPANAMMDLLNRRLIPSGAPGTANVTIEQASLDEANGMLSGTMDVQVEVTTPDGRSHGFTEASVSHSQAAPDPNASQEDVRAALYGMTKELVSDLNVPAAISVAAESGALDRLRERSGRGAGRRGGAGERSSRRRCRSLGRRLRHRRAPRRSHWWCRRPAQRRRRLFRCRRIPACRKVACRWGRCRLARSRCRPSPCRAYRCRPGPGFRSERGAAASGGGVERGGF